MNDLVTTNQTASHSSKVCEYCGNEIQAIEVEVLGSKRWVQPSCKCEVDIRKAEITRYESFQREREVRELFSISNVGDKYLNASFDNFLKRSGSENAFKIAKHYAENFSDFGQESLILWGDPGNGKTHLAAAIHNQLREQGKVVVFVSMPELLNKIKSTFNRDSEESEEQILRALNLCDLLIIDDIGAEKPTDWVQETLFIIIDSRYRREKPILATSNLNTEGLKKQIGKRIVDRMLGASQPIENKATSYREEMAKHRMSKFNAILNQ